MVIGRNVYLLTSRIASLVAASARSGRVVPEDSRIALVIRSARWTWEEYYHCSPHKRMSTTVVRSPLLRSNQSQYKIVMPRILYFLVVDSDVRGVSCEK